MISSIRPGRSCHHCPLVKWLKGKEGKVELMGVKPGAFGLLCQCSATELQLSSATTPQCLSLVLELFNGNDVLSFFPLGVASAVTVIIYFIAHYFLGWLQHSILQFALYPCTVHMIIVVHFAVCQLEEFTLCIHPTHLCHFLQTCICSQQCNLYDCALFVLTFAAIVLAIPGYSKLYKQ